MIHRACLGLAVLALLPLWFVSTAWADDQHSYIVQSSTHGPETRLVTNATELGKALQDHMVTRIVIRGEQDAPLS